MVEATQHKARLGWVVVGIVTFFELPHMVDATEHLMICQH